MSARSSPNTRVGNGGSGAKVGRCAKTDAQRSRIAARPRVTSPGGYAITAFSSYSEATASASPALENSTKSLVRSSGVRAVLGCTVAPLFAALGDFRSTHPQIEMSLRESPSADLITSVDRGHLDIALAGYGDDLPPGVESLTIIAERVVAVFPTRSRPRGRTVDLASLRDRSLICLPRGAGIRSVFDAAASVAGGAIRPAIEASSPDAIIELVYSGMGVGILSESIAAADDRVVGVPIRDVDATAHLGLLWRSRTSAAAARFVKIARDAFAVGD